MRELIQGRRVAVVGCGTSPAGKGEGREIDAHDVVIRCNRALFTAGIEADFGARTSALVIGNPGVLMRTLPGTLPFPVIAVPQPWDRHRRAWDMAVGLDRRTPSIAELGPLWTLRRKPLAGTFAALYAASLGAASITLYGIDLYRDFNRQGGSSWSMFQGHVNKSPAGGAFDLSLDEAALLGIPCSLTWKHRPASP